MDEHELLFRKNYIGMIDDEFKEDYTAYKTIKRTINSFVKSPSVEKVRSIYNKILLSTRFFGKDLIYDSVINDQDTEQCKQIAIYMICSILLFIFRHEIRKTAHISR